MGVVTVSHVPTPPDPRPVMFMFTPQISKFPQQKNADLPTFVLRGRPMLEIENTQEQGAVT